MSTKQRKMNEFAFRLGSVAAQAEQAYNALAVAEVEARILLAEIDAEFEEVYPTHPELKQLRDQIEHATANRGSATAILFAALMRDSMGHLYDISITN